MRFPQVWTFQKGLLPCPQRDLAATGLALLLKARGGRGFGEEPARGQYLGQLLQGGMNWDPLPIQSSGLTCGLSLAL